MNGLVSVIMPAYNVGKYIAESIKSVQEQTYKNWELIVVNDGSTDNTPDIVKAMAEKDSRVILHNQENGGVSRARNKGLSLAKGKYIAFLDGDDLWKPIFLEELTNAKGTADMVYCGYHRFHEDGHYEPYKGKFPDGWILPHFFQSPSHLLYMGTFIVNKTLLEKKNIRFTEGCSISEDSELTIKILTIAQVQSVPKDLMIYRIRTGSATKSKWEWEKQIESIRSRKRAIDYVLHEFRNNTRLNSLVPILHEFLSYRTFKFLWQMVKRGYHEDAIKLINGEFSDALAHTNKNTLRLGDRLRYAVVMSQNKTLWRWTTSAKTKKATA